MGHDVFISHSSKDKQTSDMICRYLENAGISCWMAPRDIAPGQDWAEAIVDAISHSQIMLLVFSSHANDSTQINREISVASEEKIPIVPFRIEDVQPSKKLRYYLSTPHWLDALPPPAEDHFDYLAKSILRFLPDTLDNEEPEEVVQQEAASEPLKELVQKETTVDVQDPEDDYIDDDLLALPSLDENTEYNIPRLVRSPPPALVKVMSSGADAEIDWWSYHPFSFSEGGEDITDAKKKIVIGTAVASILIFIIAEVWSYCNVGVHDREEVVQFTASFLILFSIIGWGLAYSAKTRPLYGPICALFATATVIFGLVIDFMLKAEGRTAAILVLPILALIIAGIIKKSPLLWIYGALNVAFAIFLGFTERTFAYLAPVGIFAMVIVLYAVVTHRNSVNERTPTS